MTIQSKDTVKYQGLVWTVEHIWNHKNGRYARISRYFGKRYVAANVFEGNWAVEFTA